MIRTFALLLLLSLSFPSYGNNRPWRMVGDAASKVPAELEEVGITEHLGESLPLHLEFTDHNGKKVRLGEYFKDDKPVLLSLVYFGCPTLCSYHLNGLTNALKEVEWSLGDEFNMVVVSIDPSEKPNLANEKRQSYIEEYGRVSATKGWNFLTGEDKNIKALAKAVGFKYRWDPNSKQWAHSSAVILNTPEGKMSRYLHGIHFEPKDVKIGLLESSQGQIGDVIDQLILYCFQYDPDRKTYAFYAYNIMRAGMGLTAIGLGFFLIPFWLRQRRSEGDKQ